MLLLRLALVFLLTLTAGAQTGARSKPDFSGEWKMNAARSDWGGMPAPLTVVRKVDHREPEITIATTQTGPQGEITTQLKYTTDGRESVNAVRGGEVRTIATWEGSSLRVNSVRKFQDIEIKIADRWTMSADGREMRVDSHVTAPEGEVIVRLVLEKQ